ncbi:oligopeptide ABC transporter ATP-binding protein [Thermocladium modestius]|uniref:Oligopeptide ABC transporter ATP-binding protein n=1 Tax=Thermocladium modestius TaxID=62609 RepID=A0A830GSH5_9CREN|nr:ABC transporter ATP-binding protein [Thermocladium modestius]GGP19573.1 oligopeptide ABC transporter ATP-binding protein [Thermocladium modestius]
MSELIKLENVGVYFSERKGLFGSRIIKALDSVNLEIRQGEAVAIVGESGAGKTTLGRVILGLQRPTTGRVLFKGTDVYRIKHRYWEFRRSVQWVPQDPYSSLDPSLTIKDQLMSPIRRWFNDAKIEKANQLLNMVGLTPPSEYLNKYPHQLSGGQRQRVSIARALAPDPLLIVADEPATMIDSTLRLMIINVLTRLVRQLNVSVAFITHDMALARLFLLKVGSGRVVVMYRGNIVEDGPIDDVIQHPRSEYTVKLINAAPKIL